MIYVLKMNNRVQGRNSHDKSSIDVYLQYVNHFIRMIETFLGTETNVYPETLCCVQIEIVYPG